MNGRPSTPRPTGRTGLWKDERHLLNVAQGRNLCPLPRRVSIRPPEIAPYPRKTDKGQGTNGCYYLLRVAFVRSMKSRSDIFVRSMILTGFLLSVFRVKADA